MGDDRECYCAEVNVLKMYQEIHGTGKPLDVLQDAYKTIARGSGVHG